MKLIEVMAPVPSIETIHKMSENQALRDIYIATPEADAIDDNRCLVRLWVADNKVQDILDYLQNILHEDDSHIAVIPVETYWPHPKVEERKEEQKATAIREALYSSIERNAHLDVNFIVLVVLSTVVATIGLIENNVAVVIGAMVIAPLLGPNLALALGTALGDWGLMLRSLLTNIAGVVTAGSMAVVIGMLWPDVLNSPELLSRTVVGLDSVALALASGAAAALSITSGLPSVLVGVMVAVALLPPTATAGLMLGAGNYQLAFSAALLLAVNVVCVNLSAKIIFMIKGIQPRTWWQKAKAKKAMRLYLIIWVISLVVLLGLIGLH